MATHRTAGRRRRRPRRPSGGSPLRRRHHERHGLADDAGCAKDVAGEATAPTKPYAATGRQSPPSMTLAKPPDGCAYGSARAVTAITVREAHHAPAISSTLGDIDA